MEGKQLTSKQELRTMNFGFCIKHKYKYAIGECDKYKYKYKHKYANAIKECGRKASKILLGGHWRSTRTVLWENPNINPNTNTKNKKF